MYTIGVFDSGLGGRSVADAIEQAFPDSNVLFRNDVQHLPYGDKSPSELLKYVVPILEDLVKEGCDTIVIACNTVTTTLIAQLREIITVPLVGIEPMVKPAATLTKTGVIAVCATPTTLSSERYAWLKNTYAKGVTVLEPDCSDWASMIEADQIDKESIAARIEDACDRNADVIVLACTHYHWIEEIIIAIAKGRAVVIQPESAIIQRLKQVLEPAR